MKKLEHSDVTAAALRLLGFIDDPENILPLLTGNRAVLVLSLDQPKLYFCDHHGPRGYIWQRGSLTEPAAWLESPMKEFVDAVDTAVRALAEVAAIIERHREQDIGEFLESDREGT